MADNRQNLRALHNEREKRRRDEIAEAYENLKKAVLPPDPETRVSREEILRRSISLILAKREVRAKRERENKALEEKNKKLKEQIRQQKHRIAELRKE